MKKQLFISILFCILCYACQQKETISPFSNDNTGNSTNGGNPTSTTGSGGGSTTTTAQGRATFWTSQTTGWSKIDVYIGGAFAGSISGYYNATPSCGSSGNVTITRNPGTYAYTAKSDDGDTWAGNVTISANGCITIRLDFSSTGGTTGGGTTGGTTGGGTTGGGNTTSQGKATFWTSQSTGWSSIDVYIGGSFAGTITGYYTSVPSCGSGNNVTITRNPGTYSYTAKSNKGDTWSGTVNIAANGCSTIRLDFSTTGGGTTGGGTTGGGSTDNTSKVLFWTNQTQYGQIDIYVNNAFKGTITNSYSSAPNCGAAGCVTVAVSGNNNTWEAKSRIGNYRWTGSYSLQAGCNTLLLK